jgi:hypothetical protein
VLPPPPPPPHGLESVISCAVGNKKFLKRYWPSTERIKYYAVLWIRNYFFGFGPSTPNSELRIRIHEAKNVQIWPETDLT